MHPLASPTTEEFRNMVCQMVVANQCSVFSCDGALNFLSLHGYQVPGVGAVVPIAKSAWFFDTPKLQSFRAVAPSWQSDEVRAQVLA